MVLGNLPVPGRPTIWITVGEGPTCTCSRCGWGFYSHFSFLSSFSLSLGVDWLVGCFGFNGPLRQYFSLYRAWELVGWLVVLGLKAL